MNLSSFCFYLCFFLFSGLFATSNECDPADTKDAISTVLSQLRPKVEKTRLRRWFIGSVALVGSVGLTYLLYYLYKTHTKQADALFAVAPADTSAAAANQPEDVRSLQEKVARVSQSSCVDSDEEEACSHPWVASYQAGHVRAQGENAQRFEAFDARMTELVCDKHEMAALLSWIARRENRSLWGLLDHVLEQAKVVDTSAVERITTELGRKKVTLSRDDQRLSTCLLTHLIKYSQEALLPFFVGDEKKLQAHQEHGVCLFDYSVSSKKRPGIWKDPGTLARCEADRVELSVQAVEKHHITSEQLPLLPLQGEQLWQHLLQSSSHSFTEALMSYFSGNSGRVNCHEEAESLVTKEVGGKAFYAAMHEALTGGIVELIEKTCSDDTTQAPHILAHYLISRYREHLHLLQAHLWWLQYQAYTNRLQPS